jgi:hypothetical protein
VAPGPPRRLAVLALLLTLLGVGAGVLVAGRPPGRPDWAAVVTDLAAARGAAFAGRGALAAADLPGSPAYAVDAARLDALRRAGLRALGLHDVVTSAVALRHTTGGAVVAVVDALSRYQLASPTGVRPVPAAPRAAWVLTLRATGGGWRLVRAAPGRG